MNIHPLFVHFPIALLTLYGIFELLSFGKLSRQSYWFYVKAILVIAGTIAALLTLPTGEAAEKLFQNGDPLREVIKIHSNFAAITTWIFSLLGTAYLIAWGEKEALIKAAPDSLVEKIWKLLLSLKRIILFAPVRILLVLAGLAAITITGALGGSIVYGSDFDPFVRVIYNWFF